MEVQPLKKVSPIYLRKKVYGTSHKKARSRYQCREQDQPQGMARQTNVPTEENRTSHTKGQIEVPMKRTGPATEKTRPRYQ